MPNLSRVACSERRVRTSRCASGRHPDLMVSVARLAGNQPGWRLRGAWLSIPAKPHCPLTKPPPPLRAFSPRVAHGASH
jgi:hypothetical protein